MSVQTVERQREFIVTPEEFVLEEGQIHQRLSDSSRKLLLPSNGPEVFRQTRDILLADYPSMSHADATKILEEVLKEKINDYQQSRNRRILFWHDC